MKFTLDTTLPEMLNVAGPDAAAGMPFAEAVFAAGGVASIFGVNDFVTVTRQPGCRLGSDRGRRDRRGSRTLVEAGRPEDATMSVTGENHAVVVGLDVGGTKTNATVLDEAGAFLIDHMTESAESCPPGPGGGDRGDRAGDGSRPGDHRQDSGCRPRGRPRHSGAGQRRRCHLGARGHQLRRARVVGVRFPRRRRAFAAPPGDLQQRRQRRRALRAPTTISVSMPPDARRSRRSWAPASAAE